MKTIIFATSLVFISVFNVSATPILAFSPEPLNLDTIEQGSSQSITLKGFNNSKHSIHLEDVISQNVGGSNYEFPPTLAPQQNFSIKFQLNTEHLEGPFTHRVVLIETDGTPHVTQIEGVVASKIMFSQRILNLDYYKSGEERQWEFYAWNPKGHNFELFLDSIAQKHFKLQTQKVKLDVNNPEKITESGKTPGLKLKLSYRNNEKAPPAGALKSIRNIVGFYSPQFPGIAVELFMVGYWQD